MMTGCQTPPLEKEKVEDKFWKHVTEKDLENWGAKFFTEHEFETVQQLANIIIPADERSGNAEEAGVPEFIDFMMLDRPENLTPVRGLNWLNYQCQSMFGNNFIDYSEDQKREMLDEIAYSETAKPEMQAGVNFFNQFRDLVASGFWSSKMGIEDIGYMGNQPYYWQSCSDKALEHVGLPSAKQKQLT